MPILITNELSEEGLASVLLFATSNDGDVFD